MLETLDDAAFASLEDAYGPAVDVPGRLRQLASGTAEDARTALSDLSAGIFHQGSYYSAAAAAVPFLIEIAAAPTPIRSDVLLFLAEMSGAPPDAPVAFDPFVFHSTPGAPDYPEAVATVSAIREGRAHYVASLGADEPAVRAAAAYLLASMAHEPDALAAALAREADETTEVALRVALARAGGALPPSASRLGSLVTLALDAFDEDALEALLLEPTIARERMAFFDGEPSTLASMRLREHADPRTWALLRRALEKRFARGERIVETKGPQPTRVRDETPPPRPDFAAYDVDRPLRTIVASLVEIAFGDRANAPGLLRRDELDERMRYVLSLTCDHGVPVAVRGAPWFEPSEMKRFLEGGGALDHEVELLGVRTPLYVALHRAVFAEKPSTQELEPIVLAAVETLDPTTLFDLVCDLLAGAYGLAEYGTPHAALMEVIDAKVMPRLVDRERFGRYAHALAADLDRTPAQARFALGPWIAANEPTPPELDHVAGSALFALRKDGLAWLRTFPEPRRSDMIARFGNGYSQSLFAEACDDMPAALVRAFVAPECAWIEHDAENVLGAVSTETLRALSLSGRRAKIVRRVLRARTREGILVLTLRTAQDSVNATLVDWNGETRFDAKLSAQPTLDELAPIALACKDVVDPLVELAGDLDRTTEYRVMRLLPESGFRGTIQQGATSMSTR